MVVAAKLANLVKLYHEQKLAHVYLLETNDMAQAYQDILTIIKQINCEGDYQENCTTCNLCNLIDQGNLPSFIEITPDGTMIKKEQVLELKKRFSYKPIYTQNNIYLIKEADKLNGTAANTMLKFIEEPSENVIGFLLTNNINNVLPTIKSRCEIISLNYEEKIADDVLAYQDVAIKYIKQTELVKVDKIMYNKSVILNDYPERADVSKIFKMIFHIYYAKYNGSEDYAFLNHLTTKELKKRVNLLITLLDNLETNANLELLLDKYVIELSDDNG